jgi:uncharacterized protein involved in type VI secretion and phage assembly
MEQQVLEYIRGHYFGKYRGKVADNIDPTNRGRIKVTVDSMPSLDMWAMPCVPYAGNQVGFYSLPPVGAGVWIEFEGGDVSFPIWVGCFWGDGELPDTTGPDVKIWKTDSLTIRLDDASGELVIQSGDATYTINTGGLTSAIGSTKLELSQTSVSINDGALEVTS